MDLTILVDNNTLFNHHFLAEPGLSIHIQDGDTSILLDTGYSEAFLTNARKMQLDLLHLDWLVLSHGHWDHTWGLGFLVRHMFESVCQDIPISRPKLLAHPKTFLSKQARGQAEIGCLMNEEKLGLHFDLQITTEPVWLTQRLVALGQIERSLAFEASPPIGTRLEADGVVGDDLPDDTSLCYVSDKGLVVIAGCAHAGICNTVEQARRVTGVDNVHTVIGGFHLLDAKAARLDPTTEYLAGLQLENLCACHCTDLAAKIAMARQCPITEVGAGVRMSFDNA